MIKISLTASGHYFIPISQTNHTIVSIAEENSCGGFSLLSIVDISSKSHNEKFKVATSQCESYIANSDMLVHQNYTNII